MRKIVGNGIILAVGIVFAAMLIAGCEEQNVSNAKSDIKKSRLEAFEKNTQLKKELKQLNAKLERRNREIEKQKGLLDKCLQEKAALEKNMEEGVDEQWNSIITIIMDENAKQRKEIDKLKKEIEELKHPDHKRKVGG